MTCQDAWGAFSHQQENGQDGQIEHPSITMLVSVPGLMVSTSPYQLNISIHDTNVGYILRNRLIALRQNAVCVLLTHLGKCLVTQTGYDGDSNEGLQAGPVG